MASKQRNFAVLLGSMLFAFGILGCGPDVDSNTTSSSSSSSSSGSSSSSSGGGDVCPANTLCLDVNVLQGSIKPARIAVGWFQLDDDGPDPVPMIAYDAPFDPAVKRVEIPLVDIAEPNEENLLCPRACNDESMCPCTGEPKLGLGLVFVADDADGNGKLDLAEINVPSSSPAGLAYMALGYSPTAQATLPAPYGTVFPQGVGAGVRPYRLMKDAQMTFDRMHQVPDGEVFDLNVCEDPANAMCMMPTPNLT